jgi:phospholipid transport system substrate-binding protein
MKKIILSVTIFLLLSGQVLSQSFAAKNDELKDFINSLGTEIISVASNKKTNKIKKKELLAGTFNENVDTEWMTKFVLGRHYRVATTSQKKQFRELYNQFIIESYAPKFIEYGGAKFSIIDIINNDNYDVVKCIFNLGEGGADLNLDFRVRTKINNYKQKNLVFDFVAEGISLIETQRSEFGSVIVRDGLEKFLTDLESKNKQLQDYNDKPRNK